MSLPCKNVDVMSSICNLTRRFCIHCAGYEARSNIKEETNNGLDDIVRLKKNNESFNSPNEKRFSSFNKGKK